MIKRKKTMEAYKIISEEVKECPFCGGTKILYSVSKANAIDAYYGQCYCDNCKAYGPRVRWVETSRGSKRYSAEQNKEHKKEAVNLWNKREVKE